MQTQNTNKQIKQQDIDHAMARGNVLRARWLEQRHAVAAHARQLIRQTVPQRVLSA